MQPAIAFSPDGQTLGSTGLQTIGLWQPKNGRLVALDKLPAGIPAGGSPRALAFSPDGKRIAWGNADGKVHLWDWDSAAPHEVGWAEGPGAVKAIAVEADGQTTAVWAGDKGFTIRTYDLVEERLRLRAMAPIGETPLTAIISPDLRALATVDETGNVRLLDPATGKERFKLEEAGPTVAFRADGKVLATLTDVGTLRRVKLDVPTPDVQPGVSLPVAPGGVSWAVISPDLQSLVRATGEAVAVVGPFGNRASIARGIA